jgi:hypothetical protein
MTASIGDLHYLTVNSASERAQIRAILLELGVKEEVAGWMFTTLEQQQRDYDALQHRLKTAEAQLPEE